MIRVRKGVRDGERGGRRRTNIGFGNGLSPCEGLEGADEAVGDSVHHGVGHALAAAITGGRVGGREREEGEDKDAR